MSPLKRYRQLAEQYEANFLAFEQAPPGPAQDAAKDKVNPKDWSKKFLELADSCPKTTAAEDSLVWIGSHLFYGTPAERAKERLLRDHADSEKLGPVFARLWYMPGSKATEALLRHEAEKSPHREMRGLATYWLAAWLRQEATWAVSARRKDLPRPLAFPEEMFESGGRDLLDRLRTLDIEPLDREAAELFARVAKDYGDIANNDRRQPVKTLGEAAKARLAVERAVPK